jgi:hypothetical protein
MSDELTNRGSDGRPAIHAERPPVSNPPEREGGLHTRSGGSKPEYPVMVDGEPCHDIAATVYCQVCAPPRPNSQLPHVGERWRHLRTGITAEVVWRYEDSLLTSAGGTVWPIDLFCSKWIPADAYVSRQTP